MIAWTALAFFRRAALLAVLVSFGAAGAAAETAAPRPVLTFGIVPQQSASRLARMWSPLLRYLGEAAGVELRFKTARDIPTFEACLAAGQYDIAYMNPYHYMVFSALAGYRALAHQSEKRLRGLIVVRKDSDIRRIEQLDGHVIAFPAPGAFGASILPRAELRARGVTFEPAYVKSHDSVYRAVAAGLKTAGGGVFGTLNGVEPALRAQLRVIYETKAYTPHAIATAPSVGDDVRIHLQQAMARLASEAPEVAKSAGILGLQPALDGEWDDVRSLGLSPADAMLETGETLACPSG